MGDIVFNIAKGRVAELYNRVDLGDPSTARLYIIPIDAGAVSDATAKDCNDLAALITAGVTERNANGWSRITLSGTDLAALADDDTNDRMPLDLGDQSLGSPTAGAVTDLVIAYSATSGPSNAQLTLLTMHDFPITPDGSAVTATVADFFRAT